MKMDGLNSCSLVEHGVSNCVKSARIQSECGKIRTRKNSEYGHFSPSQYLQEMFRTGTFGAELTLRSVSNLLNVEIKVVFFLGV